MRILHFIPEITENRDVKKEFFKHLLKMSESMKMRILTTDADTGIDNAEKMPKLLPVIGSKVGRIINEFHPDVMHIHGCTGYVELMIFKTAVKHHVPVVVSPSGSLAAITLNERSAVKQLTSEASRARKIIWGADAVHVTGDMEMETVRKLQIIPGKETSKDLLRKTFMIKNAVLTNTITAEEMRQYFEHLYKKVAWLRAYDIMLPETRECEKLMLRTGVCERYSSISTDDKNFAQNIGKEELEKIFIHAETEDVRDFIDVGCRALDISLCPDRTECRQRAGLEGNKNYDEHDSILKDIDKIRSKNKKTIRDFENYEKESELFCLMTAAQTLLKKGRLTYRHLAEICGIIIENDYQEDIALKMFKDTGTLEFMARLMQVTAEYTGLPEGFMPVEPINDKKTKDIITFLTLKSR